ncbi:MAG: acyltransferase [Hyphomicrobiaceae bacterium]|nr:acyltransferase [Hyphomicrobiaceae bacterium]
MDASLQRGSIGRNGSQELTDSRFRADIEGLRAIAVVVVVCYHAKVAGFSGGFVGVDVFFVISGFLIVGLLLREIEAGGSIALRRFWARRARRLLPNATLVLASCAVAAQLYYPAHLHDKLSGDLVAAATYWSNYRFASASVDYFQLDDALSPVLHFWSLSVEEQFYVAVPLLLVAVAALARGRRRGLTLALAAVVLAVMTLASFFTAMHYLSFDQARAFFHTEARIWQLGVGGLLAVLTLTSFGVTAQSMGRHRPFIDTCLRALGLVAIVASVVGFDDDMQYSGVHALLPTMGAALVILAGVGQAGDHKLELDHPALCWIGQRSYSWYLWHWPIMVFAPVAFPDTPAVVYAAIPASLIVAALAYRYVEVPIRYGGTSRLAPSTVLSASAAAVIFICAAAYAAPLLIQSDAPLAKDMRQKLKLARQDFGANYRDKCHLGYDAIDTPACTYGAAQATRHVVLVGDSHAAQWFSPLEAAASALGWKVTSLTKSTCPLTDVSIYYRPKKSNYRECDAWRRTVIDRIAYDLKPDLVITANQSHYGGWILDRNTGEVLSGRRARNAWTSGMIASMEKLRSSGIDVVMIRDTPRTFQSIAQCISAGGGTKCDRPRAQAVRRDVPERDVVERLSHVRLYDFTDRICDRESCPATRDGMFVFRDPHHLTATFARTLSGEFEGILRDVR